MGLGFWDWGLGLVGLRFTLLDFGFRLKVFVLPSGFMSSFRTGLAFWWMIDDSTAATGF